MLPIVPAQTAEPAPVVIRAEPKEFTRPAAEDDVAARPRYVEQVSDTTSVFDEALDVMSEGVGSTDIFEEAQHNTLRVAFQTTSFVLSAGFLTWALRGASLLASVAASLPAWQGFDPLPILAAKKRDKKVNEEEEKEKDDWQEKRVQRLLDPMNTGHSE